MKTPLERAQSAVLRKTGWDVELDDLAETMNRYSRRSIKSIEKQIDRLSGGERGGDTVEATAKIEELEIVLAARRGLQRR